jgi:hypothetical protein
MPSLDNVHKEPELKIQDEQVEEEYGSPQASSYEDTNIFYFLSNASPGASHQIP